MQCRILAAHAPEDGPDRRGEAEQQHLQLPELLDEPEDPPQPATRDTRSVQGVSVVLLVV